MDKNCLIITETFTNERIEPYWRFYAYADVIKLCGYSSINVFSNDSILVQNHGYKNAHLSQIESIIKNQKIDLVIAYTFGRNPLWLKFLRKMRIPIINKIDSDGRISLRHYPSATFNYYTRPQNSLVLKVKAAKFWLQNYLFGSKKQLSEIIENAELGDYIAFGSPGGAENYSRVLEKIGRKDLASKCIYLPNPTNEGFFKGPVKEKENIIVSIVNWNAIQTALWKNENLLVNIYKRFALLEPDWKFVILGNGAKNKFDKIFCNFANVNVMDKIDNSELPEFLRKAKILLITSWREGAPVVVNEALGMGCTVVTTPLPGVNLDMDGIVCGTFSNSFRKFGMTAALKREIENWSAGFRDPDVISEKSRKKLSNKAIASIIENCFKADRFLHNDK